MILLGKNLLWITMQEQLAYVTTSEVLGFHLMDIWRKKHL